MDGWRVGVSKRYLNLFWMAVLLIPAVSAGHPSSVAPYPDHPDTRFQIKRSQLLLKALFLEQRYQYRGARDIWKGFSRQSAAVRDHLFQNTVMIEDQIDLSAIPPTAYSIRIAATYLKWRKQWEAAYRILLSNRDLLETDAALRYLQVLLSLHLRRYADAKMALEAMEEMSDADPAQRDMLWSWYYLLTEQWQPLMAVVSELEKNAFYDPNAYPISEMPSDSQTERRQRALQALTRFPSDRELVEEIVVLFQREDALDTLYDALLSEENDDELITDWMIRGEILLQSNHLERLHRLLKQIPAAEQQEIPFLDLRARLAIREKDGTELKRIAGLYQRYYPYLRDGELYLNLLEEETGD